MATPVITLDGYRIYDNDNADVDGCTPLGPENNGVERGVGTGKAFMVRLGLGNSDAAAFNNTVGLEFNYDSGGWTPATTSSNYIRCYDGLPTNDVKCDTQLLSSSSGTWDPDGRYSEDGITDTSSAIAKLNFFECQWCVYLVSGQAEAGKVVTFRQVATGATNNYSGNVPTVTVAAAVTELAGVLRYA